MKKRPTRRATALKLVERLINTEGDEGVIALATEIRDRLKKPMADILAKVPGDTVAEKAAACGVSRQAYYAWLRGVSRPVGDPAKRIAKLTGIAEEAITAARMDLPIDRRPVSRPRRRAGASARVKRNGTQTAAAQ